MLLLETSQQSELNSMMEESIGAQPVGEGSDPFTGVAGGESVRSPVRWKALVAKRR